MRTPGVEIDASLAALLVASQFPEWADLPITSVDVDGWDNRTFRLGVDMSVRLPSGLAYAAQVEKEQRWLPILAPQLPLPIPVPLAVGRPAAGYLWNWSVYQWLDGEIATTDRIDDLTEFATTLAGFLASLQQVDPIDGPSPGPHNFFRGGPLSTYDAEARQAIATLNRRMPTGAATEVWDAAMDAAWVGSAVWFHGDVSAANLLVQDGRLHAVIDFGSSGVGDPACDVVIAWTLFAGESRDAFRTALPGDAATWARGRGWALWKALITLVRQIDINSIEAARARYVIDEVLADHLKST